MTKLIARVDAYVTALRTEDDGSQAIEAAGAALAAAVLGAGVIAAAKAIVPNIGTHFMNAVNNLGL